MKKLLLIPALFIVINFTACEGNENVEKEAKELPKGTHQVVVTENMNASNYTYLNVDENDMKYWIAVPQMKVENGDTLYFSKSMTMRNFKSDALNRTFDSVLFVDKVTRSLMGSKKNIPHPKVNTSQADVTIEPLEDGVTVKKVYDDKNNLAGETVKIRGKVTKVNPQIMGKNWIHIQDGTESNGSFDLLVTSSEIAKVGQTIIAEGKVAVDKDFGSGYSYLVLIEEATIQVEK